MILRASCYHNEVILIERVITYITKTNIGGETWIWQTVVYIVCAMIIVEGVEGNGVDNVGIVIFYM